MNRRNQNPKRIAYAEGQDLRVLRAVQIAVDDGFGDPYSGGWFPAVIEADIKKLGLRLEDGVKYHELLIRKRTRDYEMFADDYYQHHAA